jgi:hypothetical protein
VGNRRLELIEPPNAEKKIFRNPRRRLLAEVFKAGECNAGWYCAEVEGPVRCLACLQASSGNGSQPLHFSTIELYYGGKRKVA